MIMDNSKRNSDIAKIDSAVAAKLAAIKKISPGKQEQILKNILSFISGLEVGKKFDFKDAAVAN